MAIQVPAHELTMTRFCRVAGCDREVGPGEERCPTHASGRIDHQPRPRPARLLSDPLGLELGDVDFDTWTEVLRRVATVRSASHWWLGDLLRDPRWDEQTKYQTAAELTGIRVRRLYEFKWVAKAVARERRRRELSWAHHRCVAKLSPGQQVMWLQRAVDERMRVDDLRIALGDDADVDVITPVLDGRRRRQRQLRQAPDGLVPIRLEIRAPAAHVDHWRAVVDERGVPLGAIVAELLLAELGPFPDSVAAV